MKLVWLILLVTAAHVADTKEQHEEKRRTLCGRMLAEAHLEICAVINGEGNYELGPLLESFTLVRMTPKPLEELPRNSTKASRRQRREIAKVCCVQPCSIFELIEYC